MTDLIKKYGTIQKFEFTLFNEQIGIWFQMGSTLDRWACTSQNTFWSPDKKCSIHVSWSEEDRKDAYVSLVTQLCEMMRAANVENVHDLVGVSVEVQFNGDKMVSWKITD